MRANLRRSFIPLCWTSCFFSPGQAREAPAKWCYAPGMSGMQVREGLSGSCRPGPLNRPPRKKYVAHTREKTVTIKIKRNRNHNAKFIWLKIHMTISKNCHQNPPFKSSQETRSSEITKLYCHRGNIHNRAICNPSPLLNLRYTSVCVSVWVCMWGVHKRHQGDEAPFLKQHKPTEAPLCWGGNPFSKPSVLCSCMKTPPRTNQNKPRHE